MGIEPTMFRFEVGRLIHWATRPYVGNQISSTKNDESYHLSPPTIYFENDFEKLADTAVC